ncbi:DUF1924 domain-containing protein [bacterium]|nr:DUF1924 domain-containing protein [bacterium]
MLRNVLLILVAGLMAACGTLPPPAYEQPTLTYAAQERAAVRSTTTAEALLVMQPTRSLGTSVAAAPTLVPTDVPTLIPPTATVVLPTATLVEATTAAYCCRTSGGGEDDPMLTIFVGNANATNGAQLFTGTYQAEDGSEWACTTCHNVEGDVVKIGPSLAGMATAPPHGCPNLGRMAICMTRSAIRRITSWKALKRVR